jgi:hypothetical protein
VKAIRLGISLGLLGLAVSIVGCYTPSIKGGAFGCGDGGACPSGFRCAADHRCYSNSVDAKLDLQTICDSGTTTTPVCSGAPVSGECNPGCQSGCACGWCAIVNGASKCLEGTAGTKDVGATCDPARTSDCKAGLYCQPECGTGRCYKLCDPTNNTCGSQSACDQKARRVTDGGTAATSFGLCRLVVSCDPTVATSASCPTPFGCYPTGIGSQTECDCAGSFAPGQGCTFLTDCQAGYSCNGPTGATTCQQTCTTSNQCTVGSCRNSSTGPFGYCM